VSGRTDRRIKRTTICCVGMLALIAGTVSYLHMHRACELDGNVSESPRIRASSQAESRLTFDTAETAPPLPPPAVRIPTRPWKEIERLTRSNVGCGPRRKAGCET